MSASCGKVVDRSFVFNAICFFIESKVIFLYSFFYFSVYFSILLGAYILLY